MGTRIATWGMIVGAMGVVAYTSVTVSGSVASSAVSAPDASTPDLYLTVSGGASGDMQINTTDTVLYRIEFDDDPWNSDTFTLTCTGPSCVAIPTSIDLNGGDVETVKVEFTTGTTAGPISVSMTAEGFNSGLRRTATKNLTVILPMDVTTKTIPSSVTRFSEANTATFDVENTSGANRSYTITCSWGGPTDCSPSPSNPTINDGATTTVTATFDGGSVTGDHEISLTAAALGVEDTAVDTVTVDAFSGSVNVVPDDFEFYAKPSTTDTTTFDVRYPGMSASSFAMTVSCSGGATNCSVLAADDTMNVGDAGASVRVAHKSGTNGDTSTVTLTATKVGETEITSSGVMELIATSDILLDVEDANPGMEIDRSQCVRIAAGPGEISCDSYRYIYPITPVTRMNRTFSTALIHDHTLHGPRGIIGANFVLPPGVTEPDSIHATLVVGGKTIGTNSYPASSYSPGENTRIAWRWADWTQRTEKLFKYDVTLTPWSGGSPQTGVTVSGRVLSLDHYIRFNRSWWIAGLEKLAVLHTDTLVWTGPDASGGVYLKNGSNWIEQTRGVADTIKQSGSNYVRYVNGGGEVHFTSSGFHSKTVDRSGNETLFTHQVINGWDRLTSIEAPTPTGQDTIYKFGYTGPESSLNALSVRSDDGGWDTFDIYPRRFSNEGINVDSIVSPDDQKVSFDWRHGVLDSIFEPSGTRVGIGYEWSRAVTEVDVDTAGINAIAIAYRPVIPVGTFTTGWRAPTPVADLRSRFDGPQAGAADTVGFFVTGWGAARGVRDPLGNVTWVDREDGDYPALPTRVRYPNGWELESYYSSDGLVDSIVDRSTDAVTTYTWDLTHLQPDTIVSPEGVETVYTYDSNGNRLTQKTGDVEVEFRYNGVGQVDTIVDGLNNVTAFVYDSLGNLQTETSPESTWRHFWRDYVGRVTKLTSPINADDSTIVETDYDVMGRDTLTQTTNSLDANYIFTLTEYDSIGQRLTVTPWGKDSLFGTADSLSGGTSAWVYDQLGRVTKEVTPGSDTVYLAYDSAGNLKQRVVADDTVTMTYDALGRLRSRTTSAVSYNAVQGTLIRDSFPIYHPGGLTIAAAIDSFTYDVMGNMLSATNPYARIHRRYDLAGRLEVDSMKLRDYSGTFDDIQYKLVSEYDRDGRRTGVTHPNGLESDPTIYSFNANGQLSAVTDPLGNQHTFEYDDVGRAIRRNFPYGRDTLDYDDLGRLKHMGTATDSFSSGANTLTYDRRSRVTDAGSTDLEYNGLGHLKYLREISHVHSERKFWYWTNGLGHVRRDSTTSDVGMAFSQSKHESDYATGGRRIFQELLGGDTGEQFAESNWGYDDAGNMEHHTSEREVWDMLSFPAVLDATHREESRRYYAADGKLMVMQIMRDSLIEVSQSAQDSVGAYEEYWYDALGRRVLKRSRQDTDLCTVNSAGDDRCYSSIERFVWDGDQLLWETRQAGSGDTRIPGSGEQTGRIGYVHSGGVDAPIELIRNGEAVFLHRSWRGEYKAGSDEDGAQVGCYPENEPLCDDIRWPAGYWGPYNGAELRSMPMWYGSTIRGHADATGQQYKRNRYYDPVAGTFTQTDPIGIAGGLNVYGYANSDPINFSDPFGLCPWCVIAGAVWAAVELGASIADGIAVARTAIDFARGDASGGALAATTSFFALGVVGPAGGGATAARNVGGGAATTDKVLEAAGRWLGDGYSEIAPGVYRSADDARQFRMTAGDLTDPRQGAHVHFEAIGPDGKEIVENSHVLIRNE